MQSYVTDIFVSSMNCYVLLIDYNDENNTKLNFWTEWILSTKQIHCRPLLVLKTNNGRFYGE